MYCENCKKVMENIPEINQINTEEIEKFCKQNNIPCKRPNRLEFLRTFIKCCEKPRIYWHSSEDTKQEPDHWDKDNLPKPEDYYQDLLTPEQQAAGLSIEMFDDHFLVMLNICSKAIGYFTHHAVASQVQYSADRYLRKISNG